MNQRTVDSYAKQDCFGQQWPQPFPPVDRLLVVRRGVAPRLPPFLHIGCKGGVRLPH